MSADFILRSRGTVVIVDRKPFPGKVTIYYTPPSGFQARSFELPRSAFLAACSEFADKIGTAGDSEEKKPATKTLVRPVAAGV